MRVEQFLCPVAEVALAEAGHSRVDGDEKRGGAGFHRALETRSGDLAPANEVELIPERPLGAGTDLVDSAAGQRRERIGRSRVPGGTGRDDLAARIEHPAAADRREREGEREIGAEDARPEIDLRNGDGVLWPEQHVVENSAVLAERDLAIGTAVDVVEGDTRQTPLRQAPEIRNIDDVRRVDSVGHSGERNDCRLLL